MDESVNESPWLSGSQTRVCDTGPQVTSFSLFRRGSQTYSAIRSSWRKRDTRDLRLRPHQPPQSLRAVGSDPETQRQQLLAAGVALSHIYQDVGISGTSGTNSRRGWHSLDSRLAQGDTLVVASIDRIGRRWLDTMGNIHDLQRRGVRIRSLADNEQSWAQYLDADPESPESFLGYTLAGFAAWVSDQELVSIRRRTKAGLENARADGRKLGAPRRLSEEQEAAVIEVVASGVSLRRVARSFGVSPATVRRAVKRE